MHPWTVQFFDRPEVASTAYLGAVECVVNAKSIAHTDSLGRRNG